MADPLDQELRVLVQFAEDALIVFDELPHARAAVDATGDPAEGFLQRLGAFVATGRPLANEVGAAKSEVKAEQATAAELAHEVYTWQGDVREALRVVPRRAPDHVRDAVTRVRRTLVLKNERFEGSILMLRCAVPELQGAPSLTPWLGGLLDEGERLSQRGETLRRTLIGRKLERKQKIRQGERMKRAMRSELRRLTRAWAVAQTRSDQPLPDLPFTDAVDDAA